MDDTERGRDRSQIDQVMEIDDWEISQAVGGIGEIDQAIGGIGQTGQTG